MAMQKKKPASKNGFSVYLGKKVPEIIGQWVESQTSLSDSVIHLIAADICRSDGEIVDLSQPSVQRMLSQVTKITTVSASHTATIEQTSPVVEPHTPQNQDLWKGVTSELDGLF